jgi:hypothetical protein
MVKKERLPKGLRVAVFDVSGSYFSVPTLHCLYEELRDSNAELDVYIDYDFDELKAYSHVTRLPFPIYPSLWSGDLTATLRNWCSYAKHHRRLAQFRSRRHDLVLAVNPSGVVAAYQHWKRTGTPYAYLSFEMIFRDELKTPQLRAWKDAEARASRHAGLIIIQDRWRAQLMAKENGVPPESMVLLPVAPRGGGKLERTDYLRQRLGLSAGQKIVLQPGSFQSFTQAAEILESLPDWPDDLVFVLNCHYKPGDDDNYINALQKTTRGKVKILNHRLPTNEYEQMLRSADVGLALYKATYSSPYFGKNIACLGYSSGKIAYFAKYGIPIICGGSSTISECLARYRFGEYADSPRPVPALARKLCSDSERYGAEGRRFFREQLDFDLYWPEVVRRITSLIR